MPLHWFSPPVHVETDSLGRSYAVSNVEKAAEYLLQWRGDGASEPWRMAVVACMAAMKDEIPADQARDAFEAAARAANRLRFV